MLLIHGDDDRNVRFEQTVDLTRRLRAKGVAVEELVIPDDIHDFLLFRNWVRVGQATGDFFEKQLLKRATSDLEGRNGNVQERRSFSCSLSRWRRLTPRATPFRRTATYSPLLTRRSSRTRSRLTMRER